MISPIRWLQEPEDIRAKFVVAFKLEKSGGRTVENNKLVSDGISGEELYKKLSIPALQAFTGLDITDVYELFAVAIELIKNEKSNSKEETHSPRPQNDDGATATGAKKGTGRRKKKESKGAGASGAS